MSLDEIETIEPEIIVDCRKFGVKKTTGSIEEWIRNSEENDKLTTLMPYYETCLEFAPKYEGKVYLGRPKFNPDENYVLRAMAAGVALIDEFKACPYAELIGRISDKISTKIPCSSCELVRRYRIKSFDSDPINIKFTPRWFGHRKWLEHHKPFEFKREAVGDCAHQKQARRAYSSELLFTVGQMIHTKIVEKRHPKHGSKGNEKRKGKHTLLIDDISLVDVFIRQVYIPYVAFNLSLNSIKDSSIETYGLREAIESGRGMEYERSKIKQIDERILKIAKATEDDKIIPYNLLMYADLLYRGLATVEKTEKGFKFLIKLPDDFWYHFDKIIITNASLSKEELEYLRLMFPDAKFITDDWSMPVKHRIIQITDARYSKTSLRYTNTRERVFDVALEVLSLLTNVGNVSHDDLLVFTPLPAKPKLIDRIIAEQNKFKILSEDLSFIHHHYDSSCKGLNKYRTTNYMLVVGMTYGGKEDFEKRRFLLRDLQKKPCQKGPLERAIGSAPIGLETYWEEEAKRLLLQELGRIGLWTAEKPKTVILLANQNLEPYIETEKMTLKEFKQFVQKKLSKTAEQRINYELKKTKVRYQREKDSKRTKIPLRRLIQKKVGGLHLNKNLAMKTNGLWKKIDFSGFKKEFEKKDEGVGRPELVLIPTKDDQTQSQFLDEGPPLELLRSLNRNKFPEKDNDFG